MTLSKHLLAFTLASTLVLATVPGELIAYPAAPDTAPAATQQAPGTAEQLQQLVAPIALYPDALVAQILAAATYPAQVVEANRWLPQHANLQGNQLAAEVDKQSWEPSVKALTQFPSVLANMDTNLSWTSALGDAYFNQPHEVLNAVQEMRQRAQGAGKLQSTPQQTVTTQGQTISIAPVNPQVVYVPEYNPWVVYGPPVVVYPGYRLAAVFAAPIVSFGGAIHLGGVFVGGWGWHAWGCNWHRGVVIYNHNTYISRSTTFINRNDFSRVHNNLRPPQNAFAARRDGNLRQPGFRQHDEGLPNRDMGLCTQSRVCTKKRKVAQKVWRRI